MSERTVAPPQTFIESTTDWIKSNLLSSPANIAMTIILVGLLYLTIPGLLKWGLFEASFAGEEVSVCKVVNDQGVEADAPGACWTFVKVRLNQMLFGLWYTRNSEEIWRPIFVFFGFLVTIVAIASPWLPARVRLKVGLSSLVAFPIFAFAFLHGGWLGLNVAQTSDWGGLMLTLVLAVFGIVAAFPIGVLLALGRRSDKPIIRMLSILWIEFFRGTPLVTILFVGSVILPLFFPAGVELDKVLRALVALTIFQSAYLAEAIRGGLSALPRGQYEAASSLGMGYWKTTMLITLPQALKISIPGIVNSFIELFKDTSLVLIIGLLDLLNAATVSARSSEWKGYEIEAFTFAASIYFVFCYSLSRYSQHLEEKLNTSHSSTNLIVAK